ncbi:MAG: tyrosine--tRNA ligase [Candidatus Staskawiczbacteria bacterium]|nr:tyrosine--tRNA ligase [Candidatus Staskawiczbacteria bacterium]
MGKFLVSTDEKIIDELLARSIFQILPSKEALKKELLSGRRLRVYIGADVTGTELHLGHSTNFILLEKLRKLGHEVIVLFGDFTAMIGDPSGKESSRQTLSSEEIQKNLKTWKKQIAPILSFTDKKNPAKILKNSTWLKKLNFGDILKLASSFTVQHMIERDMFEKRIQEGKPVYMHEFLYPLMQGYDSAAMDVDIEIGGSDQIFNMLAGRTLQKKINNKEKFVIATTLLENPKTGKKLMSKSEGGYIALSDAPAEMYGKTMALPDEVIVQVFTDCTLLSLSEIEKIKQELNAGINPRDIKMRLARELVTLYHSALKANSAEKNFVNTFQKKEFPEDVLEVLVPVGVPLRTILSEKKIISSYSEFSRLQKSGAVKDIQSGEKIMKPDFKVMKDMDIKIGKKRFLKIKVR